MYQYEKILSNLKFGNIVPTIETVTKALDYLDISKGEVENIKYFNFIEMLKGGKFKKIAFITGAGISTTAGIPDFRSKNGLFKTLQDKYKLDSPEQFFNINFFKEQPELFYEFAKEFNLSKYDPTPTHVIYFIIISGSCHF